MQFINKLLIKHFIINPEKYKLDTNIPFLEFKPLTYTNGFYLQLNLTRFEIAYITFKFNSNEIVYSGTSQVTHYPGHNLVSDVQFYFCVKNNILCIADSILEDKREGWKKAVPYHKLYIETYPHVVELILLIYKHRHKIWKLIANISTYDITIKKIETFLLCNSFTSTFPHGVDIIIAKKILFFNELQFIIIGGNL